MRSHVLTALDGCHWRPPDTDRFKINVNAAWTINGAGVGGLIRDLSCKVRILFTVVLAHSHFPKHAEIVVIHEGLCLA